jgi:hypothetical protein
MKKERPLFVHIEQLQDMVEELLLELGHSRVALAYGKYRAKRAAQREIEHSQVHLHDAEQLELASIEQLQDIRQRVSFAKIGLATRLSDNELVGRLLRSTSISLSPEERKETIIMNAKNLLDVDADSRLFAGRILLTYIYEETLDWKISDGPQGLKDAHRKAFLAYIPKGVEIGRLDPRLAEMDLRKIADALDPFADLQFDFLGIQTLYDRYLILNRDTTTGKKRRPFLKRTAKRAPSSSTPSTKRAAPAPPRQPSSTQERPAPSCRAATCSIAAIPSKTSRKRGTASRTSRNGPADWAALGLPFAAREHISTGLMANPVALCLS